MRAALGPGFVQEWDFPEITRLYVILLWGKFKPWAHGLWNSPILKQTHVKCCWFPSENNNSIGLGPVARAQWSLQQPGRNIPVTIFKD